MHLKYTLTIFRASKLADVDCAAMMRIPQGTTNEGFFVGIRAEGDGGYGGGEASDGGLRRRKIRSGMIGDAN